jgi:hypothetical protein
LKESPDVNLEREVIIVIDQTAAAIAGGAFCAPDTMTTVGVAGGI